MPIRSIAIIGSFRKHYEQVCAALHLFREAALVVTSPLGDPVMTPDIEFVRFASDPVHQDDATVQSVTIGRIFAAELTYVVNPGGYIGRTTCYEIGRLLQAKVPVYFSDSPADLPLFVPARFVATPHDIVRRFLDGSELPQWLFLSGDHHSHELEQSAHGIPSE